MVKNILIAVLALIIIVLGIFYYANQKSLKNGSGTVINVNMDDNADAIKKGDSVLTPPALPNY